MAKYIERWQKVYESPRSHGFNHIERCLLVINHTAVTLYIGVRELPHTSRKALLQETLRIIVAAAYEAGLGAIEFSKNVMDHDAVEDGFVEHWEKHGTDPIYCQGGIVCYPPGVANEIRAVNAHFRNYTSVNAYSRLKKFDRVGESILLVIQHYFQISEEETAELVNSLPMGEILRVWLLAQGVTIPSEDILNTVIALGYRLPNGSDPVDFVTPVRAKLDSLSSELAAKVSGSFERLFFTSQPAKFTMNALPQHPNSKNVITSAQMFDGINWVDISTNEEVNHERLK